MSIRDLESLEDRERLEKLFHLPPAPPGPCREQQPGGKWQPYLIAAAASFLLVGFWNVLQPVGKEPLKEPEAIISVRSEEVQPSSQSQTAVSDDFFAEKAGLTGIVDARTMTASYYWTVVIKNNSVSRHEAMARLRLPDGGVVSRVTEWINGIPQEAAFNTTTATNFAYDSIVAQMRDPLIVNYLNKDIVDLKAFPVNPKGGLVKIRIGITAPMSVDAQGICSVSAPYLISSNFDCSGKEELHIEGRSAMTAAQEQGIEPDAPLRTEPALNGNYTLRAHFSQSQMQKLRIRTETFSDQAEFATRATHSPRGYYIHFSLKADPNGHGFIPSLKRTTIRPNLPVLNDEDAAFRLSNLWAAQEVDRLSRSGRADVAKKMGTVFRIVTPVTSAVVLESSQDYSKYGLPRQRYSVIADQTAQPADLSGSLGGGAPLLQGATNGTLAPQGSDATIIRGVNTAGSVICVADPALDWAAGALNSLVRLALVFFAILSACRLAQLKRASLSWFKK